jgi:predicted membrane channel-forming protein YqfA (hemolysin III family)
MTDTHDISTPPPANGDDEPFDARAAAALLASTRRRARTGFEQQTPLVLGLSAVLVFAIYGILWMSVRDQRPYVGPNGAVLGLVYGLVAVSAAVGSTAYHLANRGVRGKSRRDDAVYALAVGVPWIAVYVFNGALHYDGYGPALVYGIFDAAGPWLVVGAAMACLAAGRGNWKRLAAGLGVVVVGTTAAFFGPAGCWGVLAIGGCVLLLGAACYQFVSLRTA